MFPKITFISLILLAQLNMMFAAPPSNPSKPKLAEVNVSISYNEGGQFFVESCGAVNGRLLHLRQTLSKEKIFGSTIRNGNFQQRLFN